MHSSSRVPPELGRTHCRAHFVRPAQIGGQTLTRREVGIDEFTIRKPPIPISLVFKVHLLKGLKLHGKIVPTWSDAAGQDESHHAEPPKNRSTMTAYQKLVRSPSATLRASSDPITPFSLPQ